MWHLNLFSMTGVKAVNVVCPHQMTFEESWVSFNTHKVKEQAKTMICYSTQQNIFYVVIKILCQYILISIHNMYVFI